VVTNDLRPTIPDNVPTNLAKLIRKCWDRDPTKRPSFIEIIKDLESFKFWLFNHIIYSIYNIIWIRYDIIQIDVGWVFIEQKWIISIK